MNQWNEMFEGKVFISDLGESKETEKNGRKITVARYAVWSPVQGCSNHQVVEVSDDIDDLITRYNVPPDRICCLKSN
ncbi:MAG: hypothetical protein Q4F95_02710 [Oscillospiraceae bacterium]|nr:hypothetical protein [Oscillospiraceae bacterium]